MKRIYSVLLAGVLLLSLCACGQKADTSAPADAPTWQEQYDLGIRYLSEGNYEEAIIAFTAAIEIDPKRPEAYIGLSEAYTAQGDAEKTKEILDQALGILGENEAIASALAELTQPKGPRTERVDYDDGSYKIVEYNADGIRVNSTWYQVDGRIGTELFDANGKRVEETISSLADELSPASAINTRYHYDGAQVYIETTATVGGATVSAAATCTMSDPSHHVQSGFHYTRTVASGELTNAYISNVTEMDIHDRYVGELDAIPEE